MGAAAAAAAAAAANGEGVTEVGDSATAPLAKGEGMLEVGGEASGDDFVFWGAAAAAAPHAASVVRLPLVPEPRLLSGVAAAVAGD